MMKKNFIIVFFVFVSLVTFANEKINLNWSNFEGTKDEIYNQIKIKKSINTTLVGGIFMGMTATSLSIGVPLTVLFHNSLMVFASVPICIFSAVSFIVGGINLCVGGIMYSKNQQYLNKFMGSLYAKQKTGTLLIMGIVSSAIFGIGLSCFVGGELYTLIQSQYGRSSFGLLGAFWIAAYGAISCAISLPMMIVSLAMYAWFKKIQAKFAPEISMIRDTKATDLLSGNEVRLGVKIIL